MITSSTFYFIVSFIFIDLSEILMVFLYHWARGKLISHRIALLDLCLMSNDNIWLCPASLNKLETQSIERYI